MHAGLPEGKIGPATNYGEAEDWLDDGDLVSLRLGSSRWALANPESY